MSLRNGQFKPTAAFCKKEEQLRESIKTETLGKLRNDIGQLFKNDQYSDMRLQVDSKQIPVHLCILKARYQPFYHYCLSHAKDNLLVINGLPFDHLEKCLCSLYTKDIIDCSAIDKALSFKTSSKEHSSLSADLLSLLDAESDSGDVGFLVGEKVIKAHKAILATRSEYFAAMFSTYWKETSLASITIHDISSDVFVAVLKFLYGSCQQDANLPEAGELLKVSDMYGIVGLQMLIINHLKITKCHLFHKPCTYCIPQVYDCLKFCEKCCALDSLKSQCIQWIGKYFDKTLGCKQFISMSETIRREVKLEIEKQLDVSNAIETWRRCTKLVTSVDNRQTNWTRSLQDFVTIIQTTCLNVAIEHFVAICNSPIFGAFLKQINYSSTLLAQFFNAILESLTVQNCCNVLQGLLVLTQIHQGSSFNDIFDSESFAIVENSCKKCEKFVIGSIGQVSKTKAWKTISVGKQKELKDAGFFVDL